MKSQTFPGYTAELTFFKANGPYGQESKFPVETGVIPQRKKIKTVRCDCDPATDVCVCDNGRVLDPYRMLDRYWDF